MDPENRVFQGSVGRLLAASLLWLVSSMAGSAAGEVHSPPAGEGPLFGSGVVLEQEELVQRVLERNPSLESARLAWKAALNREPQATALDDPVVSYSLGPRTIGESDTRYGNVVGIAQRFPFPGKLRLRGEIARAEAEGVREDYEAMRRTLAVMASVFFSDYYAVARSLETNAQHRELVERFKRSAEAQYVAGRSSQQDPIQAEVELAHLLHEKVIIESDRDVVVARINGLLHRAPELPLPPPPESLPLLEASVPPIAQLREEALASRPELRAAEARIGGAEAALSLAYREYFPDFALSTSYSSMWENTRHRFMVGVSIELPIQLGRRRAAVGEATARRRRLDREYARIEDEIKVEVEERHRRVLESRGIVGIYRDMLLPASRDQVAAAESGFETGRNSFLALVEAERNLRTVELEYHEATAGLYRRYAELERAVGRIAGLQAEGEIK
jgi:outer membrane protein TolC